MNKIGAKNSLETVPLIDVSTGCTELSLVVVLISLTLPCAQEPPILDNLSQRPCSSAHMYPINLREKGGWGEYVV